MIERTFQLMPGVGPAREKELWRRGIRHWDDFPAQQVGLSLRADPRMREAIQSAREALARRDAQALTAMIPARDRWRLFPTFAAECAYLDIETDGRGPNPEITVIGVLHRGQIRVFVADFNLEAFESFAAEIGVLVTFNGLSFDAPVLERRFRHLRLPLAHIDLRHAARSVGLEGGLKRIENDVGIPRPLHLRGVDGFGAIGLWQRWRDAGDVEALRLLVEYNLYDAIQLEPLLERLYNRSRERELAGAEPVKESDRGDRLYDLSQVVMGLGV